MLNDAQFELGDIACWCIRNPLLKDGCHCIETSVLEIKFRDGNSWFTKAHLCAGRSDLKLVRHLLEFFLADHQFVPEPLDLIMRRMECSLQLEHHLLLLFLVRVLNLKLLCKFIRRLVWVQIRVLLD